MATALKRAMVRAGQFGSRAEFTVQGTVAPAKAARRAALVFCTLPDNRGRRKDNRSAEGEISYVRGPRGTKLVTESWGEGPLVYLVHGWGGWRGQVASFAEPIASQGYRVVAFDALSHGESDPGRWGPGHSTGAEMADSLLAVLGEVGAPHALVAHSLGCCSSGIALSGGVSPSRVALVAPNPDLAEAASTLARHLGLRRGVVTRMVGEVEKMAARDMADFDLLRTPALTPVPPTLIVHDRKDKEAPYQHAEAVAGAWPGARLVTTDGLGHHRILIDPEVISQVTGFVTG